MDMTREQTETRSRIGDAPAQSGSGNYDVLLVGAGLANSMIALALRRARPDLSIALIDRDAQVGGNHTWSFHSSDVNAAGLDLLHPMLEAQWPSQEVRFPRLKRVLDTGYNSMTSDRLHAAVMKATGIDAILSAPVSRIQSDGIELESGVRISSRCVIDGRGASKTNTLALGYQKFVGLELELDEPHGMSRPVIMDATVAQHDGYRFVYTLPFTPTRILVEDTYYSDGSELNSELLAERALQYAKTKGWRIANTVRQEQGVLPIALAGDIQAFWAEGEQQAARSGMRACLFHPTTGYSLPDAVLLAQRIAAADTFETRRIDQIVRRHSTRCWQQRSFFRLLNRMLFLAAQGDERRDILERFYSLPAPLIERFYAGRITTGDKARILLGRPPLPIQRAIHQISEGQAMEAVHRREQGRSHG
jgi:lycopene beta-cyclase